jgi:hypothetical protein
MRSTNHRKHPTRSHRNDYDFAPFGDSSASVLLTCNAARFDGEFSATGQTAPAESILSGRAIAAARKGYVHDKQDPRTSAYPVANESMKDRADEPAFFYRATLFDRVMDFLDRYDRLAAQQQPSNSQG